MSHRHRVTARSSSPAVVGVSFADASAALRAQLVLGPERAEEVAGRLAELHPDLEVVVVATCNRTELVLAGEVDIDAARAIRVFHEALGHGPVGAEAPCLTDGAVARVHLGADAGEHLFRVACGLESQLLGDHEILGQLRRAWRTAESAGRAGARLRPLFRDAFSVGKRARSTTDIGVGGAGIGAAVATVVDERDGDVVIVGAGDAGRTIARRLGKRERSITIVNRTIGRAERVAAEIGGRAVDLTGLDDALATAAVVVNAVSGDAGLLTGQRLRGIRRRSPGWEPLVVDVAATPGVDPVDGLDVVDLDLLRTFGDATTARRAAATGEVEALIDEALRRRHLRSGHPDPLAGSPAGNPEPHQQGVTPCAC